MRAINDFLEQQDVDVGRAFSILILSGTVQAAFAMLAQLTSGRLNIDLSIPLGAFVGIALWLHVAWARKLLIGVGWLTAAALVAVLAAIPFTGTARLSLTAGATSIQHPPIWQVYVLAAFGAPVLWFLLSVLHSRKARDEFDAPPPPPPR